MKFADAMLLLLVGVATSTASTPAAAQEDASSYSMADVTACSGDAMRLCKGKMPSISAIEACMREHYDQLRPKCQARFKR